jgi:hypothetical protein
MGENILERKREFRRKDFRNAGWERIVFGGVRRNGSDGLVLWGSEGEEVLSDPVEIAHINSLELLVSIPDINQYQSFYKRLAAIENILFEIEIAQATQTLLLSPPHAIDHILNV